MGFFDNAKNKFNEMKEQNQIKKEQKAEINRQISEIKNKFEQKLPITKDEKEFFQKNSFFGQGSIEKMAFKAIDKDKKEYIKTLQIQYKISDNPKYFINKDEHYFCFNGMFPVFFSEIINHNLEVEEETKTKGRSKGKTSGGLSLGKAVVGGALFGPTGAIIGGTTGKKKSKTDYDLTSYTEVKSYQLNLSTLEHGLVQLKFGPNDKTLVEQLLYCLDLSDNLKIELEDEKELYKQGTEKRLNKLENEYKDVGYIPL